MAKWREKLREVEKLREQGLTLEAIAQEMKVSSRTISYWLVREGKESLREQAKSLWQHAVFKKYGVKCPACGKPSTSPHHFFPKSVALSLQFEIENGVPLCQGCHTRIHVAQDPRIQQRIVATRGLEWYNRLIAKVEQGLTGLTTVAYYKEKIKELQNFLRN